MDLASLALVFENEGREEGNSTPAVKGVWGKSTHPSCSRAQFLKTAVQQKGAVLRPGYSDTRPSWPAWVWTSILFEPLKVSSRMSNYVFAGFIWTLLCASIFQLLFNHWSAGSTLEKSGFPPFSAHILINFLIHSIICAALFLQNFLKTNLSSSFYLSLSLQWYPLEHLHAMGLCS